MQNGEDVLDNSRRKHTIAFKHSKTNHVYIALMTSSFRKLFCECTGYVPDRYLFHCRGFEKLVSAFCSSVSFDVVNESDEEDGPQRFPKCENMFSSRVSQGFDIYSEEDDVEESIGS